MLSDMSVLENINIFCKDTINMEAGKHIVEGVFSEDIIDLADTLNDIDDVQFMTATGGTLQGTDKLTANSLVGGIRIELEVRSIPALVSLLNIFHANQELKWSTDVVPFASGKQYRDTRLVKLVVSYPIEHYSDISDDIEYTQTIAEEMTGKRKA